MSMFPLFCCAPCNYIRKDTLSSEQNSVRLWAAFILLLALFELVYFYDYNGSRNLFAGSGAVFKGSWVPHLRLTLDIGNYWSGDIGPTMAVMATVDAIQAHGADLWAHEMGNRSGTYPNYGCFTVM